MEETVKTFGNDIWNQIKGFSNEQTIFFAWLCAVRALPLLSEERNFSYWQDDMQQNHLFAVLNAIDICSVCMSNSEIKPAYITSVARSAAQDARSAIKTARTAACACAFAVYAADAAFVFNSPTSSSGNSARAAQNAARAFGETNMSVFEQIVLNDIKSIKNNTLSDLSNNTDIYGNTWSYFIEDLNNTGCEYWAKLYTGLFANRFVIDEKELVRRYYVPEAIKEQGASSVAEYLERFGETLGRYCVPEEIIEQGASTVAEYLERLGGAVKRLNETRIIILGEKGAGKTSLARRILDIDASMPDDVEGAGDMTTSIWRFPNKNGGNMNAHIGNFARHSITHAAHRSFLSSRCLYIYVYNGRIERDNNPVYWLEQIRIHGGDSPILFLINEKDGHRADIAEKTLKKDYPSIVDYYRIDIGNDNKTKLKGFIRTVMNIIHNNPLWNDQIISADADNIKNELRERFDRENSPYISREEFEDIARENGIDNSKIDEILKDLHELGICLRYEEEEFGDMSGLVLNPDWVMNGINNIINRGYEENKRVISVTQGVEILKKDERYKYPRDKTAFLFKLMRVYELAFFKDHSRIYVPGILPLDQPDGLPAFNDAQNRLTMRFTVTKALPPNITSRVIVQRCDEVFDEKLLWRRGAVLKYNNGNAITLIIEDERSIAVYIKGTDKTSYLASLRETIKNVFKSYKVTKPDLQYEVLIPKEQQERFRKVPALAARSIEPLMLSEEIIRGHLKKNRDYFDALRETDIPLSNTGIGYAIY